MTRFGFGFCAPYFAQFSYFNVDGVFCRRRARFSPSPSLNAVLYRFDATLRTQDFFRLDVFRLNRRFLLEQRDGYIRRVAVERARRREPFDRRKFFLDVRFGRSNARLGKRRRF